MAKSRPPAGPRARSDAYVGLLLLALLAQLAGVVFLLMLWLEYPEKPPTVQARPAVVAPAPAQPAPAQP